MSRDQRNNNYRNDNRTYDRSRDKRDGSWKRDRNDQWQQNRGYNRDRKGDDRHRHHHYDNRNTNRFNNSNTEKIIRDVINASVPQPEQFVICKNPVFTDPSQPKFVLKIVKDSKPPTKIVSRVDQLKNKITPIQRLWTSHIKQYLNDSQFVQIHRKNKSLAYGSVQYGKSIINYDEGDIFMQYQNKLSQSKIFSRAYFKIWEILSMKVFQGKQNESLKIASVAEGPGGFIHALIDFRLKNAPEIVDKYYAITLKIDQNTRNAKDWSDQRAKTHFDLMRGLGYKIKLSYGATKTGNLLVEQNIDYFADSDLSGQKCYLVTGDGGIQCIGDKQFDYQEVFNVKLFLGEIIAALKVQQLGGKFILKIYDCSFQLTKQLLSLLCVFYKKVRIVKPVTSRPGNSQKYMLCEDFLGLSKEEQTSLKQLLKSWTQIQPDLQYFKNKQFVINILDFPNFVNYKQVTQVLEKANKFFLQQQISKLEQGIKLAQDNENDSKNIQDILRQKRYKQQMGYAYNWCRKYGIAPIQVNVVEQDKNLQKQQNAQEKL